MIRINTNFPDMTGEARRACRLCGERYVQAELPFTAGATEPEVDEVLTGATSGATGVVVDVTVDSGAWDDDDAAGVITVSSPTGITDALWGTEDEKVNGSEGGDEMFTLDGQGYEKVYGFLFPRSELVFDEGGYYCRAHHAFKFKVKRRDEQVLTITSEGEKHD